MFIYRASFTDRAGVKHYARDYGKKAFKIYIHKNQKNVVSLK